MPLLLYIINIADNMGKLGTSLPGCCSARKGPVEGCQGGDKCRKEQLEGLYGKMRRAPQITVMH